MSLMLSKYDDRIEQITGRVMALLETAIYMIEYDFREKEKYINGISKEDIREAAQTYLTDDYTLTLLSPQKAGFLSCGRTARAAGVRAVCYGKMGRSCPLSNACLACRAAYGSGPGRAAA